jgi:phosphoribosylpyrophosphate synthetase
MRDLKIVTGTANVELAKLIASCNQVPLVRALTSRRLIRLTCALPLGEAIRRINNEESMQGLFRRV